MIYYFDENGQQYLYRADITKYQKQLYDDWWEYRWRIELHDGWLLVIDRDDFYSREAAEDKLLFYLQDHNIDIAKVLIVEREEE